MWAVALGAALLAPAVAEAAVAPVVAEAAVAPVVAEAAVAPVVAEAAVAPVVAEAAVAPLVALPALEHRHQTQSKALAQQARQEHPNPAKHDHHCAATDLPSSVSGPSPYSSHSFGPKTDASSSN